MASHGSPAPVILDRFVTEHREELFNLTEALVAFETPCPPGRNIDEAVATEDLPACTRVYARVISEWCGQ